MSNVLPFPSTGRGDDAASELKMRDVVGDVLRDERLDQERTLADVAEAAAVSLPYLSEVERGRKEVSSDLLDSICDALGLSLIEVFERSADRLRVDPGTQRGTSFQLRAA